MYKAILLGLSLAACQTSGRSRLRNVELGQAQKSSLLSNAQGQNELYSGVGRLRGQMTCTAFLWNPTGTSESPVLVLTNGHCVQNYSAPASRFEVWTDRTPENPWPVVLNYFFDTPDRHRAYNVKRIVYSTMNAFDLAILELDASWSQLKADGLAPLKLAKSAGRIGDAISVVGVPQQGFSDEEQFLRQAVCIQEGRYNLIEWGWHWYDTERNSCPDIVEGSSGSPVFNAQQEVLSIINTTSHGAISEACYLGQPCEVQAQQTALVQNKNYAMPLHSLQSCFDKAGSLHFPTACPLPRPAVLEFSDAPITPTRPVDRAGAPITWKIKINSTQLTQLQWKLGPMQTTDCRDSADYSAPQSLTEGVLTGQTLPTVHGLYALCLLGSTAKVPADLRFPSMYVLNIDTVAPSLKPELSVQDFNDFLQVEPIFVVPELAFFSQNYAPLAGSSCATMQLFPYRRLPLTIKTEELPIRFCVQGEDNVGNKGPVFEYQLPLPSKRGK